MLIREGKEREIGWFLQSGAGGNVRYFFAQSVIGSDLTPMFGRR